jgi:hypothetical protein
VLVLAAGLVVTTGCQQVQPRQRSTLATNSWTTVADVPPVFTNRVVTLPQDPTAAPQRCFRVQMKTN